MKKTLVWFTSSILILGVALVGIAFIFSYCYERDEITKYSLCYFCVSKTIRNFPLIGLDEDPKYSVSEEYKDGNKLQSAYSILKYASNKAPVEIIKEATVYLNSEGYKLEKIECVNYSECQNCCAVFVGKDSKIFISIKLNTEVNGYTPTEFNYVNINETFNFIWADKMN